MEIIYIILDALDSGFVWALLALGVFVSFRLLDFADLTAEGSIVLGASVTSILILKTNLIILSNPFISLIIAFIAGVLIGMVTGFLHTKLKIPAILSGIIAMTALYSINLMVMNKPSLYLGDLKTIYYPLEQLLLKLTFINNHQILRFLTKFLTNFILVGLISLMLYWFFGTELGMSIRATGNNKQMAISHGINTNLMVILGLGLANGLVALAGALYAQSFKSSNLDIGKGAIVIALASIILGEVVLKNTSFKKWLISVILGSIIFQALIGVVIFLGFPPNNLKLLQASLIAVVLAFPVIKETIIKLTKKGSGSNVDAQSGYKSI